MNNPALFSKTDHVLRRDAQVFINNYKTLLKWKNNEDILDVGCGSGNTTMETLLPKLPKNFNKLVCVDISEEMIQFAKIGFANPKISFSVFDISSPQVPLAFKCNFEHIFSFYCLHWVRDQRQALKNMFDMLKPGGQILLTIIVSSSNFDAWLNLAKSKKWSKYMTNVDKIIPLYHYSDDPKKDLENFLTEQGFRDCICKVEDRTFVFPSLSKFSDFFCALDPFIKNIPPDVRDDFVEEYLEYNRRHPYNVVDTQSRAILGYTAMSAFASKPLV